MFSGKRSCRAVRVRPFGQRTVLSGAGLQDYGFTGREHDDETALTYFRARHYDPEAGRFIQSDQLGFANPTSHLDPSQATRYDTPMPKDAFAHVTTWIFDLDNTLYPPEVRLFDQIEVRMTDWVMREVRVDRTEADRLRKHYWKTYGTTLAGLMREQTSTQNPISGTCTTFPSTP